MIKLFENDAQNFNNNGIKVLNPEKFEYMEITVQDNGEYYLELRTLDLEYIDLLTNGRIIYIDGLKYNEYGTEAFRIKTPVIKYGKIEIKALQLYYDSSDCVVTQGYISSKITGSGIGLQEVLNDIPNIIASDSSAPLPPFTWQADVNKTVMNYTWNATSLEDFIAQMQSIYGGHLKRHLWDVEINNRLGVDTEIRLELGKNIESYEKEENWDEVVTHLVPVSSVTYKKTVSGVTMDAHVMLSETGIDSVIVAQGVKYPTNFYKTVTFDPTEGIGENFDSENPSSTDLKNIRDDLKKLGEQYVEANKTPKFKYQVDISSLKQNVHLGDSLMCYLPHIGETDLYAQVTEISYDVLINNYIKVTIGNYISYDIKTIVNNSIDSQLSNFSSSVVSNISEEVNKIQNTTMLTITEMTTITEYPLTLGEYALSKYASRAIKQGALIELILDITFSATIANNQEVELLILSPEITPSFNRVQNCLTNNGKRGYLVLSTTGKVFFKNTSGSSIVKSTTSTDGVRSCFLFVGMAIS